MPLQVCPLDLSAFKIALFLMLCLFGSVSTCLLVEVASFFCFIFILYTFLLLIRIVLNIATSRYRRRRVGYAPVKRVFCPSLYAAYVRYSMRMRESKVT